MYFIMLLVGPLIGLLVAFDGYMWCSVQTALRGALTADARTTLIAGTTVFGCFSFMVATACAVPPVMRPSTLGGTSLGHVTDTLGVWEA